MGILTGLVAAAAYLVVVRFGRVPRPRTWRSGSAVALAAFAAAESVGEESGLWATTALGVALANQAWVSLEALHEFGSHVGMLLIGSLFIVLSARIDLDALVLYHAGHAGPARVPGARRPAARGRARHDAHRAVPAERAMVGWMAPRGIVAASTASVFALQFDDAGKPFPALVPDRLRRGAVHRDRLRGHRSAGRTPAGRARRPSSSRIDDDGVPREISDRS